MRFDSSVATSSDDRRPFSSSDVSDNNSRSIDGVCSSSAESSSIAMTLIVVNIPRAVRLEK